MATIDRTGLNRNDFVRESRVLMATMEIDATVTSGDVFQVGVIPAGSVIKSVNTVVKTAVDGTTPTLDVGTTATGDLYEDALDVSTTGLDVSATADAYNAGDVVLTVTPTLSGATTGTVLVYVEYLSDIFTGTYATEQ